MGRDTRSLEADHHAPGADRFVVADGLRTRYLDFPGRDPTLVLLHGLSANANEFGGLVGAGLSPSFRIVAPDLRGRGRTDKPVSGYSMAHHASDVIALLDALGLERVVLGGHSFGALLAIFIAADYPERVSKLIIIDAAITLHPQVREMLKPSLDRLTQVLPSVESYIQQVRTAPFVADCWDAALEGYYRAEIQENPDGTAQSATSASAIAQALEGVAAEPWRELVGRVTQPVLLLNALGPYGPPGSPPLVSREHARDTAAAFADCSYVQVPGNHLTVVFGDNAAVVRREIETFVRNGAV
ncbi:MAG: alpha/beta fold hydrolase [Gemmatimonadaceae bacterium]